MFKISTFRLKLQPSSGESDKNLHRERTYNEEKCKFLVKDLVPKGHLPNSLGRLRQESALADHCLRSGFSISWESSKILRTSANWRNRRLLEA